MNFPSKEQVEQIRAQYPAGTRVELIAMDDPYSKLKAGDRATIEGVDDVGDLLCKWDSGSSLKLILSADQFRKLTKAEVIKEQCKKVAATGRTNMFDIKAAFDIAMELGFMELCDFMGENAKGYSTLILTGKLPDQPPIVVARPINGITINGDEYLLDDNGEVLKFKSRAEAEKYLLAHDLTAEEIAGLRFIEVESE
jgi:hypothetical protein